MSPRPITSLLTEAARRLISTQLIKNRDIPMTDQEVCNNTGTTISDLPADILEAVMANLSILDLLSASRVSHKWFHAAQSTLHIRPRLFPWLLLLSTPYPNTSIYLIRAFDPHSRIWLSAILQTREKPPLAPKFLHGSRRDLLYTISITQLVISKDPFGCLSQMKVKGPKIWRQDPVLAEIGRWVVVVGGGFMAAFDSSVYEGAVEVHDKETGAWELAEPMPTKFEGSACAMWLSVAVSDKRLYVIEKKNGWISWFDPESKIWGPTCQLRPDPTLSNWAIGTAGKEKLLLVGAGSGGGENNGAMMVRTWTVAGDALQVINDKEEEVPMEMVDRLYPNFDTLDNHRRRACSIEVRGTLHGGYMFDPANMKNGAIMYQLALEEDVEGRRVANWEWVSFPSTVQYNLKSNVSVGCSRVSLDEVACRFL